MCDDSSSMKTIKFFLAKPKLNTFFSKDTNIGTFCCLERLSLAHRLK